MTHKSLDRGTIRDNVRDYLRSTFRRSLSDCELRDDQDLLLVLDSLQLLRMVVELESRFHVRISPGDMTPENLGTIERIARYLEHRLKGSAA